MLTQANDRKSYSELVRIPSFKERFDYLKLTGDVGAATFGGHRVINQAFYRSKEWRNLRRGIILRDCGCDLGVLGFEYGPKTIVVLHHINPLSIDEIASNSDALLDPDNIISCSFRTHNAIHYGSYDLIADDIAVRTPNDTCPWRKK